jgi:hypothetical protein
MEAIKILVTYPIIHIFFIVLTNGGLFQGKKSQEGLQTSHFSNTSDLHVPNNTDVGEYVA